MTTAEQIAAKIDQNNAFSSAVDLCKDCSTWKQDKEDREEVSGWYTFEDGSSIYASTGDGGGYAYACRVGPNDDGYACESSADDGVAGVAEGKTIAEQVVGCIDADFPFSSALTVCRTNGATWKEDEGDGPEVSGRYTFADGSQILATSGADGGRVCVVQPGPTDADEPAAAMTIDEALARMGLYRIESYGHSGWLICELAGCDREELDDVTDAHLAEWIARHQDCPEGFDPSTACNQVEDIEPDERENILFEFASELEADAAGKELLNEYRRRFPSLTEDLERLWLNEVAELEEDRGGGAIADECSESFAADCSDINQDAFHRC